MFRKSIMIISLLIGFAGAEQKISDRLVRYVDALSAEKVTVWIYFKDKGPLPEAFPVTISERALKRRMKQNLSEPVSDFADLPVYAPYLSKISRYVSAIRVTSRWLNAASVETDSGHLDEIARLDCVGGIDLVMTYQKHLPDERNALKKKTDGSQTMPLDYGPSFTQMEQIAVPALHERGLFGQGVLICMLDDGFNLYRSHDCFDSLDVVDTWDFINQDSSVDDPEASPIEGWHGTMTLSVIAGYAPGELIGPAFRSSYLLGKTEVDNSETEVEEDYWVAGLEWAEAKGADIVSSSLGYFDWYTWEDMDGEKAVTTFAADMAASRGVVVVNSAGNEGFNTEHNTLVAPADGDLVIGVGAVTAEGIRSEFSSTGPTADGRIKPDVAAMGSGNRVACYSDSTTYRYASGTSFSCPLVAGVIAQLLTANPSLTVREVREALTSTASQAGAPDNLLGWGIINAEEAYLFVQSGINRISDPEQPVLFTLEQNYPNPFNAQTSIGYWLLTVGHVELSIYTISGQKITTLVNGNQQAGYHAVQWDASNYPSGIYCIQLSANGQRLKAGSQTRKMILLK